MPSPPAGYIWCASRGAAIYGCGTLAMTGGHDHFFVRCADSSAGGFEAGGSAFGGADNRSTNPDCYFGDRDSNQVRVVLQGDTDLKIEGGDNRFVVAHEYTHPDAGRRQLCQRGSGNNQGVVVYDCAWTGGGFSTVEGVAEGPRIANGSNEGSVGGDSDSFIVA